MANRNDVYYGNAEPPVIAGCDAKIFQDGNLVGWATNVSVDENFFQTAIKVLGNRGPIGYKSVDYEGRMTVGTFVLKTDAWDDSLKTPNRQNIINFGSSTFRLTSADDETLIGVIRGAKCNTQRFNFATGDLVAKDTEWVFTEFTKGDVS